ncbi:MAG: sugar ABC transporter permease [Anaerolineae bacterium]
MATVPQAQSQAAVSPKRTARRKFSLTPYLFLLPHFIFFALFVGWPFFYGFYISLFRFDFLMPEFRPFVGLENYINLFTPDSIQFSDFWNSMKNTGLFVLYSVPPLVIIPLLLAVLLNGRFRFRNAFRGIYFAPWTLSVTVAALVWWWIFQDQGGLINYYLGELGLPQPSWLGSLPWAWIAITTMTVWWTVGFNTIIFLAALTDIPTSLYEAAAIDGAGAFRQFIDITVPMLSAVILFVVTITIIASFNLFGQPFVMTRGGPAQGTEPVMMRIYIEGFGVYRMGSAAAMSFFVAAIMLIFTYFNFKLFGRSEPD